MFFPLENTCAPVTPVLMRNTHRATNSRSSSWLSASLEGSGVRKYRHIMGSSVMAFSLRVGIFERLIISKCRSRKSSHSLRAAVLS